MLLLDHLTIIAPSLAEGVEHVRTCLDIDIPYGTTHPEMGTHNHRLRLGAEIYLEVIAIDPAAPRPVGPRWFGLDQHDEVRACWEQGKRLRAWVARTSDIDAVLSVHFEMFGGKTRIGQHTQLSLRADGALPLGGALPSLIDRAGRSPPSVNMTDHGAQLRNFTLEHPAPARIKALYTALDICDAPQVVEGASPRYFAAIETPRGLKQLY
jgi:hypothetical protein